MKSFVTHPKNPITTWSPSKESTFAECPAHAAYDVTHKPPEDMGPALVHGRAVHDELAAVAMGQRELVSVVEAKSYAASTVLTEELAAFARARAAGDAHAELEVALNRKLELVDWFAKDVWYRAKIDLLYRSVVNEITVSDWKTGRPAAKDKAQLTQYAWVAAILAKADRFHTRLVYLKSNTVDKATYTLAEVKRFAKHWKKRGEHITDPKTRILATPSEHACRYCPHARGTCKFAYTKTSVAGIRHKWGGGSL
jgi:RecB family exonuclease